MTDGSRDSDREGVGCRGGVIVCVAVGVGLARRLSLAEKAAVVDTDKERLESGLEVEWVCVVDNVNDRLERVKGVIVRDAVGSFENDSVKVVEFVSESDRV